MVSGLRCFRALTAADCCTLVARITALA